MAGAIIFFIGTVLVNFRKYVSVTDFGLFQAGRVLADYCAENITLFENRKILELGCGVGLTGLAVIFACRPLHYCFTDVHEEVLNYLVKNIKLNEAVIHSRAEGQNVYFESANLESEISVVNLCWGNVNSNLFTSYTPDVILAAGNAHYTSSVL